jgi:hypothetical protein
LSTSLLELLAEIGCALCSAAAAEIFSVARFKF